MRITIPVPRSSFLSAEKDMNIIIDQILKNERLKRLLFYTSKDCLDKPNITEDQSIELLGKNIKNIPKLTIDKDVLNYIVIHFDNFLPSGNPEFRDNVVEFDIICHYDQWILKDFQLRPYKIAAEIDSMFNNKHLSGIGTLQFLSANQMVLNKEFAGFCVKYLAVHGQEDKKIFPNPNDEETFLKDFETYLENNQNG